MDDHLLIYVIEEDARLIDAAQTIVNNKSRCGVVVSGEKVVGVISEGDVLRALLKGADIHSAVRNWTNHSFRFLETTDYPAAHRIMASTGIVLLPVIDEDFRLVDVITSVDLLLSLQPNDEASS